MDLDWESDLPGRPQLVIREREPMVMQDRNQNSSLKLNNTYWSQTSDYFFKTSYILLL